MPGPSFAGTDAGVHVAALERFTSGFVRAAEAKPRAGWAGSGDGPNVEANPRSGAREAEGDGLLIRCSGYNRYRGFESLPLRFPSR